MKKRNRGLRQSGIASRPAAPARREKHEVGRSVDSFASDVPGLGDANNLALICRNHWRRGDWAALCNVRTDGLETLAQRAQIALMLASAHQAMANHDQSMLYARHSRQWGCDPVLIARVLLGGIHNTLGRAAAAGGASQERLVYHFGEAVAPGTGGRMQWQSVDVRMEHQLRDLRGDALLLRGPTVAAPVLSADRATDRPRERLAALHLPGGEAGELPPSSFDYSPVSPEKAQAICTSLLSDDAEVRRRGLGDAACAIQQVSGTEKQLQLETTTLDSHADRFTFLHVADDYIPRKIATDRQFYESAFLEFLWKFHEPGGLVVDAGANVGNHTVFFSKVMGAEVLAIEPQPDNASLLGFNTVLNGVAERVHIYRNAVGAEPGVARLAMVSEGNFGSFGRVEQSATDILPSTVEVSVIELDRVLAAMLPGRPVSIMKVDVEGMEIEVLRGARQMIREMLPVIAVECFTYAQFVAIEAELSAEGYFAYDMLNATPTFVLLSWKSERHRLALSRFTRTASITKASRKSGFLPA